MGLDMYLTKKKWLGLGVTVTATKTEKEKNIESIKKEIFKDVTYITQEVGYWRKANEIHNWFVQNVQNGVDDCGEYEVSIEKLKKLKEDCVSVLNSKEMAITGAEKLPTCDGFFFGSTEYDEWYKEDLKNTIEIIDNVLKDYDEYNDTIFYSSSW